MNSDNNSVINNSNAMTLHKYFNKVDSGPWTTFGKDVQIKLENRILYFQCSKGFSDWAHNLLVTKAVYSNSDIEFIMHDGFRQLWLSVKDYIESLDFDIIVGYSEGAALATAAHENFFHRKGFEPETITFGAPALIYKPSVQLRQRFTHLYNFINPGDVVYYSTLLFGYQHVGQTIKLPKVKLAPARSVKEFILNASNHTPERYVLATLVYEEILTRR